MFPGCGVLTEPPSGTRLQGHAERQYDYLLRIECRFVFFESFHKPMIGPPPHPFWLWRKVPFLRVKIADQAPLDPFHAEVGPIHRRHELRFVSDLS